MDKKQIKEIRDFIIFLQLNKWCQLDRLLIDGFTLLYDLKIQYPSFKDIDKESKKIIKWLESERKEN